MAFQCGVYSCRAVEQFAAAIGAAFVQCIGAVGAEGAFERADERPALIGGEIDAAAFAVGAHFQHRRVFRRGADERLA
ncbi:hypothetical protein TS85_02020 [Sphingomonas hengshuiensis]|uniref:Uncharacterized protein n=1 Tax=Sphingomonas hengshuiensis TaxID=1609977 RepID=A0A7U5BEK0_9SPHN|nr:hypothetical protein TS85_02020 [Sphingomonas hengshuiensis]